MQRLEKYMIILTIILPAVFGLGLFQERIFGEVGGVVYRTSPEDKILIQDLKNGNSVLADKINTIANEKISLESQIKELKNKGAAAPSNDGTLQTKIGSLERDLRLKDNEIVQLQKDLSAKTANPTLGDQTDKEQQVKSKNYKISQLEKEISKLKKI